MKKKMLILMLCVALAVSAFALTAAAAGNVAKIQITDFDVPVDGGSPDFTVSYGEGCLPASVSISGIFNSVSWSALDANQKETTMTPSDVFEYGKTYRVRFYVKPDSTFTFSSSTVGLVNGETVDVFAGPAYSSYKILTHDYTCVRKPIETVTVTGLILPKAGNTPDNDCNILTDGVSVNDLSWYNVTDRKTCQWTDTFESGKRYKLTLWLRSDFQNGYYFSVDEDEYLSVKVNINGVEYTTNISDCNYAAEIEYTYYVPYTNIENVDIVDVAIPVAGETPDYEVAATTSGYDITNVYWWDSTTKEKYISGDGKTFIEGHSYMVCVDIIPHQDYLFAANPDDVDIIKISRTVNGNKADGSSAYVSSRKADVTYSFGAPALKDIEETNILDVDAPVAGRYPDFDVTVYFLDKNYTVSDMYWYDSTAKERITKDKTKQFVAGHQYLVCLTLSAKENYGFSNDYYGDLTVRGYINGKQADMSMKEQDNYKVIYTDLSFAHTCAFEKKDQVNATCTAAGKKAYYKCSCGICAEDSLGVTTIADINSWGVLKALGHKWVAATCTEAKTCSVCKTTSGSALGHSWSKKYTTDKAATYTAKGSKSKHCTRKGCTEKTSVKSIDKLVLGKVKGLKAKKVTVDKASAITLTWTKTTGAKEYEVQQYVKKKWKTVKTTSKNSFTIKKLKANTSYKFRVRAVVKGAAGKYSSTLTVKTVPAETTLKLKAGKKLFTASWTAVSDVTGYEVQYSTSKKMKKAKTVIVKKAKTKKTTVKKLKKGSKYYVRVRTYKTVSGKKIYSGWSKIQSVKIK